MTQRPRADGAWLRLCAIGALPLAACAQPGQPLPPAPLPAAPAAEAGKTPRPVSPGREVPGTRVQVPQSAKRGQWLEGRVPAGSAVECDGLAIAVSDEGVFRLRVADDSKAGSLRLRVLRPGRTPMTFEVPIED